MPSSLGSAWPDWSSASVIYKPDQVSYTRQIFVLPYVVCDNETKLFTATVTLEGIVLSERSQGKSPYWSEKTTGQRKPVGRVLTEQHKVLASTPSPT